MVNARPEAEVAEIAVRLILWRTLEVIVTLMAGDEAVVPMACWHGGFHEWVWSVNCVRTEEMFYISNTLFKLCSGFQNTMCSK